MLAWLLNLDFAAGPADQNPYFAVTWSHDVYFSVVQPAEPQFTVKRQDDVTFKLTE